MRPEAWMDLGIALVFSPFLFGLINRTKAKFAGRTGQPLLQTYFDLWKLLHKGAVYSRTTTWVFRAGPIVGLATALVVVAMIPAAGGAALLSFEGDFLVAVYLLGLMRFFTVLAALDTGSSFEGMGASREVTFSAIAEVPFLLGIGALAWKTGSLSLSNIFTIQSSGVWKSADTVFGLVGISLMIVLLAENARIPVDDPNTHLELTMIHEVMVLDHSGPDFAMILYGTALKLWIFSALIVDLFRPMHGGGPWSQRAIFLVGMAVVAIGVGVIESTMARLRLLHVHRLLVGAGVFSALAMILVLR